MAALAGLAGFLGGHLERWLLSQLLAQHALEPYSV
jgi:hypothetical protein